MSKESHFTQTVINRVSLDHYKGSCSTWRVKRIKHSSFNLLTGDETPRGEETVLEQCNTPLFDEPSGICRSCATGWQVNGNRPATLQEIEEFLP